MGFKDKLLTNFANTHIGGRCSVGLWYDKQTPDICSDFDAALEDNTFTSVAIARVIRADYDADLGAHTVARHRRGDCKCL
jgi:hypothetical protein